MKTECPDRLYVRKDNLEDYELLKKEKDSIFFGKENKDIFIMAMILGYYNKKKKCLDKKEGFFREEYLNDEERSLIKAIAIKEEGNLSVLLDKQKVYSIAEEYAAGGIGYLKDEVFNKQHGGYLKKLEEKLVEEFEEEIKIK